MKKLAFVIPTYEGGGAERVMVNIALNLSKEGLCKVYVVGLLESVNSSKEGGLIYLGLGAERVAQSFGKLKNFLNLEKPDAVISTLKHVTALVSFSKIFARARFRHICRLANTYSCELMALSPFKRGIYKCMVRLSDRYIDSYIAVSKGVKDDLIGIVGKSASKITVIKNPIDIQLVNKKSIETIEKLPIKHNKWILAVGRLAPQKNYPLLINAFRKVRESINVGLIILGDGPQKEYLQSQIAEAGLEDSVYLGGYVKNPYPYYKMSDLFVLSSNYEGYPNVLVEAIALNLPFISADCPSGPREICEEIGGCDKYMLVPMDDSEQLAKNIIQVLAMSPGETVYGKRASFLESYDIRVVADKYWRVAEGEASLSS